MLGFFLKTFEDKVKDVRASTEGSVPAEYSNFIGDYLTRFSEVSLEDVEMLIRKSSNKSCGLDPAPTWLIRDFAVELAPFICALFKQIPVSWFSSKDHSRSPISHRSSRNHPSMPSVPSNYRPISNLCYLSKLLERIVNNQLVEHLQVNDLMPEHQSAYRRCHSTETALLKLSSDVLMAADSGMVTLLAMLDLSAAFDCVDHRILLTRLDRSFGVWGTHSTGSDPTFTIELNGSVITFKTAAAAVLEFGVPQGSVLGPLYFLLLHSRRLSLGSSKWFQNSRLCRRSATLQPLFNWRHGIAESEYVLLY